MFCVQLIKGDIQLPGVTYCRVTQKWLQTFLPVAFKILYLCGLARLHPVLIYLPFSYVVMAYNAHKRSYLPPLLRTLLFCPWHTGVRCLVRRCESMLTTKYLAGRPVGMFQGLLMPWSQLSEYDWCHGHGSVNIVNLCGSAGALRVMWSLVGHTVFAQREVWRPSSLSLTFTLTGGYLTDQRQMVTGHWCQRQAPVDIYSMCPVRSGGQWGT